MGIRRKILSAAAAGIFYFNTFLISSCAVENKRMPDLSNYHTITKVKDSCFNVFNPDIEIRMQYNDENRKFAWSVSRVGKERPFAIILEDGFAYFDNGLNNGAPEDGFVDSVKDLYEKPSPKICDSMPWDKDSDLERMTGVRFPVYVIERRYR